MDRTYSDTARLERASLRVAMHIRGMWEETGASDTRLLESPLMPDQLTVVGRSRAFNGKGRREHVIPRLVVIRQCLEMLKQGEADEAIAKYIRDHVKIVLISREECERLDRAAHLGLKQKMPSEWTPGDDVFARLSSAQIEWEPYTYQLKEIETA